MAPAALDTDIVLADGSEIVRQSCLQLKAIRVWEAATSVRLLAAAFIVVVIGAASLKRRTTWVRSTGTTYWSLHWTIGIRVTTCLQEDWDLTRYDTSYCCSNNWDLSCSRDHCTSGSWNGRCHTPAEEDMSLQGCSDCREGFERWFKILSLKDHVIRERNLKDDLR